MKCFFSVTFCILSFTSCIERTDYERGSNVVLGVWCSYYEDTDSLVMTRVFTNDYYSYFSFSEGKSQNELNKQGYSITENSLVLDRYTQSFRMTDDTLWITNSKQDQTTKYIRQKKKYPTLE